MDAPLNFLESVAAIAAVGLIAWNFYNRSSGQADILPVVEKTFKTIETTTRTSLQSQQSTTPLLLLFVSLLLVALVLLGAVTMYRRYQIKYSRRGAQDLDIEKRLRKCHQRLNASERSLNDCLQRFEGCTKERDAANKRADRYESRLSGATELIGNLEKQLEDSRRKHAVVLKDTRAEILNLQQDYSNLQNERAEALQHSSDLEKQAKELQDKITSSNRTLRQSSRNEAAALAGWEAAELALSAAESAHRAAKSTLSASQLEHESSVRCLQIDLGASERERASLVKKEKRLIEFYHSKMEQERVGAATSLRDLKEQQRQSDGTIEQEKCKFRAMQDAYNAVNPALISAKDELAKLQATTAALQTENQQSKEEKLGWAAEKLTVESTVKSLKRDLKKTKTRHQSLRREQKRVKKTRGALADGTNSPPSPSTAPSPPSLPGPEAVKVHSVPTAQHLWMTVSDSKLDTNAARQQTQPARNIPVQPSSVKVVSSVQHSAPVCEERLEVDGRNPNLGSVYQSEHPSHQKFDVRSQHLQAPSSLQSVSYSPLVASLGQGDRGAIPRAIVPPTVSPAHTSQGSSAAKCGPATHGSSSLGPASASASMTIPAASQSNKAKVQVSPAPALPPKPTIEHWRERCTCEAEAKKMYKQDMKRYKKRIETSATKSGSTNTDQQTSAAVAHHSRMEIEPSPAQTIPPAGQYDASDPYPEMPEFDDDDNIIGPPAESSNVSAPENMQDICGNFDEDMERHSWEPTNLQRLYSEEVSSLFGSTLKLKLDSPS